MDVTLMELLWTFRTDQEIAIYRGNMSVTGGIITVRDAIEEGYYGHHNNQVDFIKPEKYGGILGYKEKLIIEIHLK